LREPRVFTIPAGTPFLPTLAEALLDGTLTGGWPERTTLADATVYLPTRRAGRAFAARLAERAGRRALLLPRIVPLGDVDEDLFEPGGDATPPIPTGERRLILARLIQSWASAEPRIGVSPDAAADAVGLAGDLVALMDSLATEGVDWDELASAVAVDHSEYYANTLSFVRIAHEAWPRILAERGASDPARRRHEALLAEAERLTREPPRGPIVAAGSTGSIPATARLLAAIARLPHGALVLPGLDTELDEAAWLSVGGRAGTEEPEAGPLWTHPQCMMRRFLADPLGIQRSAVRVLGPHLEQTHPVAARRRMASEIMRPAETTDVWSRSPLEREIAADAGCEGLALIEAADEREEALAVAIALRETLEEPGRTAALVTPDRALARRVAVELKRWDVEVEDSAGSPLAETPAGRLARLTAEVVASGFKPLPLLALLAHPAVTLGGPRAEIEAAAAALEIGVLRGPAPGAGLQGVAAALELRRVKRGRRDPVPRQNLSENDWKRASDLLDRLARAFDGFVDEAEGGAQNLVALAGPHAATLLALVDGAEAETADRSWSEVLGLLDELACMPEQAGIRGSFGDYPAFLTTLLRERVLAPDLRSGHRRVKILGLLEARLLEVDRIVLGALDESIWPPTAENDAFLNMPLRLKLGLSPAERRIGQTAHDFAQALGTPDAILTRARKRDAKPTVPSRFLERLRAFVGPSAWARLGQKGGRYLNLAKTLDASRPAVPARRPAPRPGPERFPRSLSVTEIETLVRDPYAIFARHVLRLSPLDPIGALPTAAERGTILHDILAQFAAAHPGELPSLAREALLQLGSNAFGPLKDAYPELHALWWPDFQRIAPHVLSWEAERRAAFGSRFLERDGRLEITIAEGDVLTVRARADRIEARDGGQAAIIDFKSGQVPTDRVVAAGFSPQLTLEAAMLMQGGFREVPAATATPELHYVKLGGRARLAAREVQDIRDGVSVAAMIDAHVAGLTALARRFAVEGGGYVSRPYPQFASRYAPYDHLARVAEWSVQEDDEAGP
jgi:ATP-dependent helicase/nuclease subunit B